MPYIENITNHYILVPFTCIYKFQQQKCEKSKLMAKASKNMVRVFHNGLWIANFHLPKYGQKLIFYTDR